MAPDLAQKSSAGERAALSGLPQKNISPDSWRGRFANQAGLAAVESHFRTLKREPTQAEIETIARTWAGHGERTAFTAPIRFSDGKKTSLIKNLFDETIGKAAMSGGRPWRPSMLRNNSGIVAFGSKWALAYKVETSGHACEAGAGEPYCDAQIAMGGAIRGVMAAGLGAKPILSTDVFCLAPPDYAGPLPGHALHPRRVMSRMVSGVRDYANRMGIPTASGALWFDEACLPNPLVFCGAVGLMPAWALRGEVKPGDLIVAAGGRTGRGGLRPTEASGSAPEEAQLGNVSISHAINEKTLLDALLNARDKKLYRAAASCGAGGLAAAVAELAAACGAHGGGARVSLDKVLLKTPDLAPWEIWLSESQERMLFAVPARSLKAFEGAFASEGCETAVLGEFTGARRLEATYAGAPVVNLDLSFLHEGPAQAERNAVYISPKNLTAKNPVRKNDLSHILAECLGHLNVCSREWVMRQYDYEAQGGTVIKPMQGIRHDGPGDACVIWPHAATGNPADFQGFAASHGLNPAYGKLDAYRMALACADEALRNLLCVGADISRAAFICNFCWSDQNDPAQLGALVRAAQGCRDAAAGFAAPFISGQYSPYAQSQDAPGRKSVLPGVLLLSALAPVADVRKALTMDIKGPGNALYLTGWTAAELGGSLYHEICGCGPGFAVPTADPRSARSSFKAVQSAMAKGLILSAHDLSEGGLGVAAAEMCFTGEFGASLDLDKLPRRAPIYADEILLFSESPSRLLLEVDPDHEAAFLKALRGLPARRVGTTMANPVLKVAGLDGRVCLEAALCDLKSVWQDALPKRLG